MTVRQRCGPMDPRAPRRTWVPAERVYDLPRQQQYGAFADSI
ncbi:MAG: hypothetical protein ACK56F_05240 [bacterium]